MSFEMTSIQTLGKEVKMMKRSGLFPWTEEVTRVKPRNRLIHKLCLISCLLLMIVSAAPFVSAANYLAEEPSGLLPKNTVLLVKSMGTKNFAEAYKKSAFYEAMESSELLPLMQKGVEFAKSKAPGEEVTMICNIIQKIQEEESYFAVSLPEDANQPPIPQLTLLFANCGNEADTIMGLLSKVTGPNGKEEQIEQRKVFQVMIPDSPGIEIGIWAEGNHLMLTAGMGATRKAIAVCNGKFSTLKQGVMAKLMQEQKGGAGLTMQAWLDMDAILKAVSVIPVPPDFKPDTNVGDILNVLGINSLQSMYSQAGYSGKSYSSYSEVKMSDNPTGICKPTTTDTFKVEDLLPLPENSMSFNACSVNIKAGYDNLEKLVFKFIQEFAPPHVQDEAKHGYAEFQKTLGIDIKEDLLDAMGNLCCFYNDPDTGILGTGFSFAVKVKDQAKLAATFDKLMEKTANADRCPFTIFKKETRGKPLYVFEFSDERSRVSLQTGAIGFDKDWMIIGMMPQSVTSYFLRKEGKLNHWKPTDEVKAGLSELPAEIQGISYMDVRQGYKLLLNLAYLGAPFLQSAIYNSDFLAKGEELPFHIEDLPPVELVTKPLFPNLSVTTSDGSTIKVHTRNSTGGIPLLSGGSLTDPSVFAVVGIGTALLLPAIQQAREAARRTQSKNNMKQQALAFHNYVDTHRDFPLASIPNKNLKTEERLSHFVNMLPYLEQNAVYSQIKQEEKWNSDNNDTWARTVIMTNVSPSYSSPTNKQGYALTGYVGIAGVGKDEAESAKASSKSGIYHHTRKISFRDVTDGTSNTMMMMEVSEKSAGPWMQSGNSTVRSFTQKPYINGPDGFGGVYKGGANAALTDGSVRFISENTDPSVIENLAGRSDGNVIGEF